MAVNVLQQVENIIVQPNELWLCGLIELINLSMNLIYLLNYGYGASPDGLVGEDDIVEIKCPYKYRKCKLSDSITEDQSYIINKINNELFLNKHHKYWHQIHGQLYMTKRSRCFLVVWTPEESIIVHLFKNTNGSKNHYHKTIFPRTLGTIHFRRKQIINFS